MNSIQCEFSFQGDCSEKNYFFRFGNPDSDVYCICKTHVKDFLSNSSGSRFTTEEDYILTKTINELSVQIPWPGE